MREKVKKFFCLFILVAILLVNSPVEAKEIDEKSNPSISMYSEQIKVYYRYYGEGVQKRIWSVTYGYWLTNWIWVDL